MFNPKKDKLKDRVLEELATIRVSCTEEEKGGLDLSAYNIVTGYRWIYTCLTGHYLCNRARDIMEKSWADLEMQNKGHYYTDLECYIYLHSSEETRAKMIEFIQGKIDKLEKWHI